MSGLNDVARFDRVEQPDGGGSLQVRDVPTLLFGVLFLGFAVARDGN